MATPSSHPSPARTTGATAIPTEQRGAPERQPRRRRGWRIALWAMLALALLLALLLGGVWTWAGSAQSLAAALARAERHLPAGQTLSTQDVTGSLRQGGHIGRLRWESPSLAVEVRDATLGWTVSPLLRREVRVQTLHAASVTVERRGPPDDAPLEPLEALTLPVDIDLPFRIDALRWAGPPAVEAQGLVGRYGYSGGSHRLQIDGVDVAQGHYSGQLSLQGAAPMALDASLHAELRTPVPGGAQPLTVAGDATVRGALAGQEARLRVDAQLQAAVAAPAAADAAPPARTESAPGVGAPGATPQVRLQAEVAPWQPQPLLTAHADVAGLDVSRIWAQAPHTLLEGTINAGPAPAAGPGVAGPAGPSAPSAPASITDVAWQLRAELRNSASGPWDRQRLPFERLDARARLDAGVWTITDARADIGGGSIGFDGRWGPAPEAASAAPSAPAPWQARAHLQAIVPAALHTALEGPVIGGDIKAQGGGQTIDFDLALATLTGASPAATPAVRAARSTGGARPGRRTQAPAPAPSALQGLRLRDAVATGRWTFDRQSLELQRLRVRAEGASVEGTAQVAVAERAGSGKLAIVLPGGEALVDGSIGPAKGAGNTSARIADAQALQAWIEALPGLSDVFGGVRASGAAQLDARWQGGWQTALQQFTRGPAPADSKAKNGADFNLTATLLASRLEVTLPSDAQGSTAKNTAPNRPLAQVPPTKAATKTIAKAARPQKSDGTRIALDNVRAELSGSIADATIALQGRARSGTASGELRMRVRAGLDGPARGHATVSSLQLEAGDSQLPGPWSMALEAPVAVTVRQEGGTLAIDAGAGRATVRGPTPGTVALAWEPVRFAQTASSAGTADGTAESGYRLQSRGRLIGLPMAWAQAIAAGPMAGGQPQGADPLAQLGLTGDLVFDGDWDIDATDTLKARVQLSRTGGDIRIRTGDAEVVTRVSSSGTGTGAQGAAANATPATGVIAAGVRQARLALQADGDTVRAEVAWDSERAGQVNGTAQTRLRRADGGWQWPADAPLAGTLRARLPSIGVWSVLAPPGWRVQGTLEADATLAGSRDAPRWSGTLRADGLSVRSIVDGIDLHDGRLRAVLEGDRLRITEFQLRGGTGPSTRIAGIAGSRTTARALSGSVDGGTLTASGEIGWGGARAGSGGDGAPSIRMNLQARADALRVSVRTDRQVTVSGTLNVRLEDGRFTLRGALKTDRAAIILPDDTAPSLGSDVVVRSAATDRAGAQKAERSAAAAERVETAKPPDIAITFDLGDDFAVQGRGITTRLTGQLDIRSSAGLALPPRVTGEIRTVSGQYRAYGQSLDIESGLARFNGPLDNPALDILAVRPNISVRAGVRVTGTAQAPQVRLYSDPVLSDAETLSWVVLGRSTANGGAEAAVLQQAALALISGNKGGSGNIAKKFGLDDIGFKGPGSGNDASAAALTFGKRVSQNVYLTYERSLSGALGTLYIFYDLTRRLTLRGQAGVKSGLDLIYTIKYD